MVLDYSKWDALELSDDSDIEVHPNVDKRSFIRAKQAQIHQQRQQRRMEIETLKYERIINDGLLSRIDKLLALLREHEGSPRDPEELVFQAVMESASNPAEDQAPAPPEGVHTHEKEQPKYSQMLSALVDQVKKEIGELNPDNRYRAYIKGVEGHQDKVQGLQKELLARLAQLEKEESSKITSDMLHTGFDTSYVSKSMDKGKAPATAKAESVELLNPRAVQNDEPKADDNEQVDPEDVKASDLAKKFARINRNDYRTLLQFISEHPEIVAEKETDGLLVEAFNSQMEGKEEYARQCVHQGLLLQYCRSLGRDGISLFFKRITTKDHQASTLFRNDVNETYNKIKTRAAELAKDSSAANDPAGVEQIQLHAVDPNTKITINIPPADSNDPAEIEARKIFESFSEDLQKALASESLDEVNKVLGEMPVNEAEEVVEKLGAGGLLSLEEGIVDATTEEGRKKLEEIEAEGRKEKHEDIGEPGGDVTELD
ncbi:hsp90 co-chaperone Cdc37 [Aspergillus udagawae]|uniref:Hsp90 chaperone protein kinase-targeting subunit n=1 Tax=Aspergillus udagawae TaxID=91492 RepID=A0A8H3NS20_9EURO|nr:hsp90 co-chaperone Cdc37 [Aspergillus udagawae]GFF37454.1 hsp90 co-chaperone Cdc37 [Aspergillus udagawae]GFF96578.1 hsp90 co-chaperone Cdc37 [Aspergillus udagawae]GFG10875.1 hsp90 co-chaperone Cdc37 [Aspergillus udagawae]GFG25028.1 hsp90 co-chaperone Cdc37 [Aspergillus udagawae]